MTKEELQNLIKKEILSAKEMRDIGEAYVRGDVLLDKIAAEAWLLRVVEQEDEQESLLAMGVLAKEVYGREYAVTEQDYQQMQEDWKSGRKTKELEILLSIAFKERE